MTAEIDIDYGSTSHLLNTGGNRTGIPLITVISAAIRMASYSSLIPAASYSSNAHMHAGGASLYGTVA